MNISPNKALHLTAIPLRSIAAGELSRYLGRCASEITGPRAEHSLVI
ncbi:hypothetical protein NNO_1189 [Hydrogenimonas sp.]|nr:hypothetical protein NNO_1189 [Hydrogenimonas sp.]